MPYLIISIRTPRILPSACCLPLTVTLFYKQLNTWKWCSFMKLMDVRTVMSCLWIYRLIQYLLIWYSYVFDHVLSEVDIWGFIFANSDNLLHLFLFHLFFFNSFYSSFYSTFVIFTNIISNFTSKIGHKQVTTSLLK